MTAAVQLLAENTAEHYYEVAEKRHAPYQAGDCDEGVPLAEAGARLRNQRDELNDEAKHLQAGMRRR